MLLHNPLYFYTVVKNIVASSSITVQKRGFKTEKKTYQYRADLQLRFCGEALMLFCPIEIETI
jgi:hypothetical protein